MKTKEKNVYIDWTMYTFDLVQGIEKAASETKVQEKW